MKYEDIFDSSYNRLTKQQKNMDDFFDAFYYEFIGSSPIIAKHFEGTDMQRQKKMLHKSFYGLFVFYATKNENDNLNKIAEKHNKKGLNIPPELYDLWLESMIKTVRNKDPEFSDEVELSWRLVLTPGIVYMKFKYDKD